MTVKVRIERLILVGLPLGSEDGALVQAAVEAELSRLLVEGGLPAHWQDGSESARPAPVLRWSPLVDATQLGTHIGAAVYERVGGVHPQESVSHRAGVAVEGRP